ncbi:MAG: vanadium-dependent haloperoxidase, partial [Nocardioidaceae bacterium]
ALGAKTGSTRTPAMTATALFWNYNSVQQFQEAMRDLSERHQMSARRAARMFAAVNMTTADALITCWRAKHDFAFWRPLTAIRNAATDGNDATTADPAWEPLATTPPYPDYPSGHACITGSVATGLAQLAGSDHIDLTVPSGGDRTVPSRHFDSARAMIREAFLARILLGLHFRTAMEDASFIGQQASLLGFAALGVGEGHRHGGHRGHSGHSGHSGHGGHGGHGGRR